MQSRKRKPKQSIVVFLSLGDWDDRYSGSFGWIEFAWAEYHREVIYIEKKLQKPTVGSPQVFGWRLNCETFHETRISTGKEKLSGKEQLQDTYTLNNFQNSDRADQPERWEFIKCPRHLVETPIGSHFSNRCKLVLENRLP